MAKFSKSLRTSSPHWDTYSKGFQTDQHPTCIQSAELWPLNLVLKWCYFENLSLVVAGDSSDLYSPRLWLKQCRFHDYRYSLLVLHVHLPCRAIPVYYTSLLVLASSLQNVFLHLENIQSHASLSNWMGNILL